jgi:hypothetical protein
MASTQQTIEDSLPLDQEEKTPPEPVGLVEALAMVGESRKQEDAAQADPLAVWGVGDSWLSEYERMARRVTGSTTLPKGLKTAKDVLAVALAGRELGLGFMEATRQIHIVSGKTTLSAELKLGLAKREGLIVDEITFARQASGLPTGCTITAHRKDTGESVTASFTEEDKKRAKLSTDPDSAWSTYPEDMYFARAATRLVRRLAPDAKGASFRSVEEISDEVIE